MSRILREWFTHDQQLGPGVFAHGVVFVTVGFIVHLVEEKPHLSDLELKADTGVLCGDEVEFFSFLEETGAIFGNIFWFELLGSLVTDVWVASEEHKSENMSPGVDFAIVSDRTVLGTVQYDRQIIVSCCGLRERETYFSTSFKLTS